MAAPMTPTTPTDSAGLLTGELFQHIHAKTTHASREATATWARLHAEIVA